MPRILDQEIIVANLILSNWNQPWDLIHYGLVTQYAILVNTD